MKDYSKVKSGIPAEERNRIIEVIEKAAGRPYSDMYTLEYDYQRLVTYRDDIKYTVQLSEYPPVGYLQSEEIRSVITEIFQNIDPATYKWDKTLKDYVSMIVFLSISQSIVKKAQRMLEFGLDYGELIQAAFMCVQKELPTYDFNKGKVQFTTFFDRKILKAFEELQIEEEDSHKKNRYSLEIEKSIKKAIESLAEDGVDEPSYKQISDKTKSYERFLSVDSVARYYNEQVKKIPLDSDTRSLSTESFTRQLTEDYEQEEINSELKRMISKLPEVSQFVISFYMQYYKMYGKTASQTKRNEAVKAKYPNLRIDDINRYATNAMAEIGTLYSKAAEKRNLDLSNGIGKHAQAAVDNDMENMLLTIEEKE